MSQFHLKLRHARRIEWMLPKYDIVILVDQLLLFLLGRCTVRCHLDDLILWITSVTWFSD